MSKTRHHDRERSERGKSLRRKNSVGKLKTYGDDGTSYGYYKRRRQQMEEENPDE